MFIKTKIGPSISALWSQTSANASFEEPEPCFNKKIPSYQYRKSHCGDKTILRPSYLRNGISFTGKITSLYRIKTLLVMCVSTIHWLANWCLNKMVDILQTTFNRKWQDYVYIQCEYKSTKQKIKHLLREENKMCIDMKYTYFDSNFSIFPMDPLKSNLSPDHHQAITWTNITQFTNAYMRH